MRVLISNDIKIYNPSEDILTWISNNMIITNPLYKQMKLLGKEDTIRLKHIPEKLKLYTDIRGCITLPFGVLYAIWPLIKNHEVTTTFNDNGQISFKNDVSLLSPYDYQETAINAMLRAKGGVLKAPCRSGKTMVGINLVHRIGKKALWLCHTGDLLRQAKDDFLKVFPNAKIGLTTNGILEIGEDITISTVQTMDKIDPRIYENVFDIVIIDECHHCVSSPTQTKMFGRVISKIQARYKYGLTATPDRNDGMSRAMYAYIGTSQDGSFKPTYEIPPTAVKKIDAIHFKYELNSGYTTEKMYELYDASGMMVYNKLLSNLVENEQRNQSIIENIKKCHEEQRKQCVLSHRKSHCKHLVEKLNDIGINAVLCTGDISDKRRKEILDQTIDWDVIIATNSLLKEGITINELDTLHLVTPFKDGNLATQCVGRIEGCSPNKKQPIAFDYVDMDIPYCVKRYDDRRRALRKRKK